MDFPGPRGDWNAMSQPCTLSLLLYNSKTLAAAFLFHLLQPSFLRSWYSVSVGWVGRRLVWHSQRGRGVPDIIVWQTCVRTASGGNTEEK